MRSVLLTWFMVAVFTGVAEAQRSQAPAWLMPPPPSATSSVPHAVGNSHAVPQGPTRDFYYIAPNPAADLPLSIYASPLIIYAVKGLIARLATHGPAQAPVGDTTSDKSLLSSAR
jgi:hypothetical protein